jgi:hypothetical protein
MKASVSDLLRKITYIEADTEIQKQILFSIPSGDTDGIHRQLEVIAQKKAMIHALREEIKAIDPEAHGRILLFEEAVKTFREMAATRRFTRVETLAGNGECTLVLNSGKRVDCLVKAQDQEGYWTVFTPEGEVVVYTGDEVPGD